RAIHQLNSKEHTMARGINKVILIGNLGADPETRAMPSGTTVANLRVATSESWRDKQTGEQQERTEWHRVAFFGRLAEVAGEYLRKGSQVYIEGSLRTRKWQDKQGNERYSTEIIGSDLQMLGSRGGGGAVSAPGAGAAASGGAGASAGGGAGAGADLVATDDPLEADLLLMNTCSVREKAQEKVFSLLGEWRLLKARRPQVIIGVGGCVASQEGAGITERAPFVDLVFGPQTLHRLPQMLDELRGTGKPVVDVSFPEIEKFDRLPAPRAEGARAFVSIMEGCSKY